MWGKEKKGMQCYPNEDGTETCKRMLKTKEGQLVWDGQEVTIGADPGSGCDPYFDGNFIVMDDEASVFDEAAKRVQAGCKRKQQAPQPEYS